MKAMLQQIEAQKIERKTSFFFGAKTKADLFYMDELKAWQEKMPHFTFVPTLSRTTEQDQWTGEKGRVTNLIEKQIPEKADLDVYICGSPPMVESCVTLLTKKGIPEEHIYFDKFE